jgi:carboxymethylenebutenolidase
MLTLDGRILVGDCDARSEAAVRSEVSIPLSDGTILRAVLCTPAGTRPEAGWPGVVVLHEVFGTAPETLDAADRFADRGWVAIVPDLFSHGTRIACLMRAIRESRKGSPGRVSADIEATRGWLSSRPEVDGSRLGVIGFCLGGGFALAYAAMAPPGVRAAAVNYGEVPKETSALRGVCPIVGSYGGRDRIIGPQAARLEQHLDALGVPHDVQLYPRAGHSFMTQGHHPIGKLFFLPMRLGYSGPDAEDAWNRTFAFFDTYIKT